MSDGVPTPEQLRRIERGVMGRIDRRRRIGQRIAGATAAVALLGGGVALLGPLVGTSGTSTGGAASGAGSTAEDAGGAATVLCHASSARDSAVREVPVDPAGLPGSALTACGTVEFQSGTGRLPAAASATPSTVSGPSARGLAVCRAADDVLHVFPLTGSSSRAAAEALCARNGMVAADP